MCQQQPQASPAPDYVGAAQAQGQANLQAGQQSASLSNPNVTSPYGNQTVTYTPTGPDGAMQSNVNQTLTPEAQQTLNAQQQVQYGLAQLGQQGLGTAQNVLGSPFQYNGPGVQTSLGNYGQVNPSLYGQATGIGSGPSAQTGLDLSGVAQMPVSAGTTGQQAIMARLQPEINQSSQALTQQLANQGIPQGSEAWNNAMRQQGNQQNDLYSQAALQGINLDMSANQQGYNQALGAAGLYNQGLGQNFSQALGSNQSQNSAIAQNYSMGSGAQQQNFNQALGAGQFGNTASQQSLAQQLSLYNQPLNEITALMSGSQIQNPQFQGYSGSQIAPAPIANATAQQGQYAQNLYGQQMAAYNSQQQGLASLLGAGASMFSFGVPL